MIADPMPAGEAGEPAIGLRERKKQQMRRQLSDTAARMFLERGFDAVRVAEVGAACGVSEKTVFNYFPTKEALVLDRLEPFVDALRARLRDRSVPPVTAMVDLLHDELDDLVADLNAAAQGDGQPDRELDHALARYRRFGDLIRTNPSLLAYQAAMIDRFSGVAAATLAARAGLHPDDPEPQITAAALLGLWKIQNRALRTHLHPGGSITATIAAVTRQVQQAATLLEHGLATFPAETPHHLRTTTGQPRVR